MTESISPFRAQLEADGAVFAHDNGIELAAHYGDSTAEYHAALRGAVLYDASAAGRLWMYDRDQAALLHRLSTNAIETLKPGQGTQTVLTNHNGRIIDLLTVHMLPAEAEQPPRPNKNAAASYAAHPSPLLLVTSPQQRDAVFSLLRKNIFFSDKVKLEQASATMGQINLYGPQSAALLAAVSGVEHAALPLHHIAPAAIGGVALWVAGLKPLGIDGGQRTVDDDAGSDPPSPVSGHAYALYLPVEGMAAVWAALRAAGAVAMGQVAYDVLRVEAGYGAYARELSLEYIPLETGLWDAISFNKGCYVGQEIIARMESRNRLAKQLRGLRLDTGGATDADAPAQAFALPAKLEVDGKEAGDLTSVVHSPRFGLIGLAYVRSAHAAPGTRVGIVGSTAHGDVVALPFTQ